MSFIANYVMLDDDTLDRFLDLDNDALMEKIGELEESGAALYSTDKLWDGLHFLLTGESASTPIAGDELSEAVVGAEAFNEEDENADFIAATDSGRLADIVEAMKDVDIDKLAGSADFSEFREAGIYPDIWHDEDADALKKELADEYRNLLAFYEKALEADTGILVSIF